MCLALTLTSPPHHHLLLLIRILIIIIISSSSSSSSSSSLQRPFGAEAGGGIPQGQPRGSAGRLAGHFDRPQPLPRSVHEGLNAGHGASEIRAGRRTSSGQAHSPELPEDPLLHEHVRRPPRAPLQPRHNDNYARIWLESRCYGAPADVHPRVCPLGHPRHYYSSHRISLYSAMNHPSSKSKENQPSAKTDGISQSLPIQTRNVN
jgi:hypothetical protein